MMSQDIGRRIRDLREANGHTREAFAALLDVTPRTLQRYEKGDQLPSSEVLLKLQELLGADPNSILLGTESTPAAAARDVLAQIAKLSLPYLKY
jgi:transcriptional regulator with XRE-family HTH domain